MNVARLSSTSFALDLPKSIDLLPPPICLVNIQIVTPAKINIGTTSIATDSHDDASGSFNIVNLKSLELSLAVVIFDMNSSDLGM